MKNKTSFSVKTLISQIFVPGLVLFVLLSPSITFGQGVQLSASAVSDADVWSNGVILEGTTGTVNYRWFEFGASNSFSSFVNATPHRGYDGNVNYVEKITGLSPDTLYTFRSVVEINGTRYYGNTMSFKTKVPGYGEPSAVATGNYSYSSGSSYFGNNNYNSNSGSQSNNTSNTGNNSSNNTGYSYNYSYNSYYSSSVVTKRADFLSFTSARLNANIFPSSEYNVYGWYEWGTTPNFGNSTSRVFIGKGPSLYFGQILSGLIPGTNYYFRPVIENVNGTRVEGTTLVFRTSGVSPYGSVNADADPYYNYYYYESHNTNYTNNSVKFNPSYGSTGSVKTAIADSKKTITIEYASSETTVVPGEKIYKKLLLENATGEELTHVSARVILPDGETFVSTGNDACKQIAGQVLYCEIGKMSIGQKNEIAYEIEVARGLKDGTSLEIITVAAGEYKDGRKVENFHRSESLVDSSKENANLASAFFGSTDSSLRDLFMSIEFILLLILSYFVWKHLSEKNKKEELNNLEALAYLHSQEVVVPKKQNDFSSSVVTEKGIPPINLPV